MVTHRFDHTWLIYKKIIDETIKNCESLQSEAVLRALKQKWLQHLSEHIQTQQTTTKLEPRKAVKLEPVDMSLDTGTSVAPPKQPSAAAPAFPHTGNNTSEPALDTGTWSGGGGAPQESIATGPMSSDNAEVVEVIPDDASDDEWGKWEDPEEVEIKQKQSANKAKQPVVPFHESQEAKDQSEAAKLHDALAADPTIPQDTDFSARLRTQYGVSGLGQVEDPDDVNSDLDELSSLSETEPEADDYIIGQCEELVKPGGRKAQVQGTWRLKMKGGIANIGGREFMFDQMEANLDF